MSLCLSLSCAFIAGCSSCCSIHVPCDFRAVQSAPVFHTHDVLTSCNSAVFERAHIKAWQNEEMEEAMAEAAKREEEVCHAPFLCTKRPTARHCVLSETRLQLCCLQQYTTLQFRSGTSAQGTEKEGSRLQEENPCLGLWSNLS